MKFYLWYDEISKSFVVGRASDFVFPKSDILYVFDKKHLSAARKIAQNLNMIA